MRYFELIQSKKFESVASSEVETGKMKRTKVLKIPAGVGPVQVCVRDGKIFLLLAGPARAPYQPLIGNSSFFETERIFYMFF